MSPAAAAGPRVVFLTAEPGSASARVRIGHLLPGLARHGVRAEVVPLPRGLLARRRLFAALDRPDAVVLHRKLLDRFALAALRRRTPALLFDLDDAVYARPFRTAGGGREARRFRALLRAADLIVAGSEHLRAEAGRHHPRVRLLPPAALHPRLARTGPAPGAPVGLIWTGSRATLPYLEDLGPLLARLARERPFRLEVLADAPPRLPPGVPVTFRPWSLEAEEQALARAEVGLYPLRDDPWSRGKCAYKVHRYMSFGLATVASRHGAGAELLAEGGGLLADGPGPWTAALEALLDAPQRRAALGREARASWLASHTPERRAEALAAIVREGIGAGTGRGVCNPGGG